MDKGFSPGTGEERGDAFTKENFCPDFRQKREGREFLLCLLFLACRQLKIILCQSSVGLAFSDPLQFKMKEATGARTATKLLMDKLGQEGCVEPITSFRS